MNKWIIGKNLMKHYYLKEKIFTVIQIWKILLMQITRNCLRICKDFETKNLREYHDLYVQSNTLLLADVFENFRNICLKIYELDPAKFLSAP